MDRGSDKHGPRLDEQQKQETEGLVRGGGTSRAQEWKEPEPMPAAGEQEPRKYAPGHEPGTAKGIDAYGVELRSDMARWVPDSIFPAGREELVRQAERPEVPDAVARALEKVPEGQYRNIGEVAEALGLGVERRG